MATTARMVNAWIFLYEEDSAGIFHRNPPPCHQSLVDRDVYGSADVLYLCFATTLPVGPDTVPSDTQAPAGSYTIAIGAAPHPDGLTNQDYMDWVIRDARLTNPAIRIAMTLDWSDGGLLPAIFDNSPFTPEQAAGHFAANLLAYMTHYDLDGFDLDWEPPARDDTRRDQFRMLVEATGSLFKAQVDRRSALTLSPASAGRLDAAAVTRSLDAIDLQLGSGRADPAAVFETGLFGDDATVEPHDQAAEGAGDDTEPIYGYRTFTCWRLNSDTYVFEQTQQKALCALVFNR